MRRQTRVHGGFEPLSECPSLQEVYLNRTKVGGALQPLVDAKLGKLRKVDVTDTAAYRL